MSTQITTGRAVPYEGPAIEPIDLVAAQREHREALARLHRRLRAVAEARPTPNAARVLEKRYLARDEDGRSTEDATSMYRRVAHDIAAAEEGAPHAPLQAADLEQVYFALMATGLFLPNSPTLMNAGRPLQQLSACFVLPVEDSLDSIFDAVKHTAVIHKSGGGTGFSFSRLRPKADVVRSTKGISSGPVSFMSVFNAATETIKQGGTRRGANMGILRVDHPDILEFVRAKREAGRLSNFNISVSITDDFMAALETGAPFTLRNPRTGKPASTVDPRALFGEICQAAWESGDPGLIFIDRINRANSTQHAGPIESTNPCGEQPLHPYESCNLGSINLGKLIDVGEDGTAQVDFEALHDLVHAGVRFLDDVIDRNQYPLPEIEAATKANRRIGLGVMGWADLLVRLGVRYDSPQALQLAGEVMSHIESTARRASAALAAERGAFPHWKGSSFDRTDGPLQRNCAVTTVAPTGTIAILADASSGIEPLFSLAYVRRAMDTERLVEVNEDFLVAARAAGDNAAALIEHVELHGNLAGAVGVPAWLRELFRTAYEIAPQWHVRMQAAFQKHTDNAVSKTINLPAGATPADIQESYLKAWKLGCKGITVYRDQSREGQVLSAGTSQST